jgi:ABC-type multidrug transport system ATPase subunit
MFEEDTAVWSTSMKTLRFRNWQAGRKKGQPLVRLDSEETEFSLRPGIWLLAAPNGFGKSTFMQSLAGVIRPQGGAAEWAGSDSADVALHVEEQVLAISEYLSFPKFVYPAEWMSYVSRRDDFSADPKWVEGFRVKELLGRFLGRMSQGERRKMTWLAADASPAEILLMDEPLDGLDLLAIDTAKRMLRHWKETGKTVILAAHQLLEVVDLADDILLITEGRLRPLSQVYQESSSDELKSGALKALGVSPEALQRWILDFYSDSLSGQPPGA